MKSPFKFLDSYTKDDRDIFFGRDREIEELYHRVFESRLLLVYGISGTGKSSLIHCGLANKFQDTDWLPIVVRRGGNIIESLLAGINASSITEKHTDLSAPAMFRKAVRSLYLDHYKPVFFIFDQFEELFIFGTKEERKSFIQVVKILTEGDLQCRMIFVMREEYMAGVTEFEKYIPTFFSNRIRIEKMSHANAIEAIEKPSGVAGIKLDEGFSEALLERLSPEGKEVELTYLQVYLDKLFSKAMKGKAEGTGLEFTKILLESTGNVTDLLGNFLEEQISLSEHPDMALAVLKSFVSVRGTKRQLNPEDISEFSRTLGKNISFYDLSRILQSFVQLRILCERDQNGKYELRHDSLAAIIFNKITIVEKEILEVRQFLENAYLNYEKRNLFLQPDDLKYIAPYVERMFLSRNLGLFVENSRKKLLEKKRVFNRIIMYSAAAFLFIASSIIIYYFRSGVKAKSEELSIESFLQSDFSPALSLETAIKAYRKDTTSSVAIKAMFNAFYKMLDSGPYTDTSGKIIDPWKAILDFVPCASVIKDAKFSNDGKYIYGFLEDNTIKIWDIKGHEVFSKSADTSRIVSLKLSPYNEVIAALYRDSTVYLWNKDGRLVFQSNAVYEPLCPVNAIDFSRHLNLFLFFEGDNKIKILNIINFKSYELSGHNGEVNAAKFSPDGKFIASASKDSTIIIWQYQTPGGRYKEVNRIRNSNGYMWSIDFSSTSKYILTIEDIKKGVTLEEPVKIRNLMGEIVSSIPFVYDSALISDFPRIYKGNYYCANFTANNAAIKLASFNQLFNDTEDEKVSDKSNGYDYYRLKYSENNLFSLIPSETHLQGYGRDRKGNVIDVKKAMDYEYSFSDATLKKLAFCKSNTTWSDLINYDRMPILRLKGIRPLFSPSGKYLLCIDGSELKLYPADEKELINLFENNKLFGNVDGDPREWIHFFRDF